MSLWWQRASKQGEARDTGLPGMSLDQVLARLKTSSYADVDLSSAEASLQAVAVFAATDLIASLVSELPVDVFRGQDAERVKLTTPRWLEDPDGSGHGLPDWSYRALMSWLLRGNIYGDELQRSSSGYLQQVELFHPDRVTASMEDGAVNWFVQGTQIPSDRMLHRRVNPVAGVLLGLSPIQMQANTIGLQLTAGRFGLQWFQDGALPGALLTNSETTLDQDQADTVKAKFLAAVRGKREPAVLGKGWKYEAIQVNAEESQFLATQGYSAAECARIFGPGIAEILGYETGGGMTYANIQDRDITLLKYAVGRWIRRLERVLSEFLPRPQYVKLNRDALLETSTMSRYLAHASALGSNWETINEVRQLEDRPPVPWGNAPFTPGPTAAQEPGPAADPTSEE